MCWVYNWISFYQGSNFIGLMKIKTFSRHIFNFFPDRWTGQEGWSLGFDNILLKGVVSASHFLKKVLNFDNFHGFWCRKWCFLMLIMMVNVHYLTFCKNSRQSDWFIFFKTKWSFLQPFPGLKGQNWITNLFQIYLD